MPLNNDRPGSVSGSSHPVYQPAAENLGDLAISPDPPAFTGATLDIDTSPRTMPLETSTSTASVPPTGDLSLQDNTGLLVHSDAPEIPFPILPAPVLEDILPRESQSSIMARTSPGTSPWPTSAHELVAAAGDEGSTKASSREDHHKDALDIPPIDRASGASTMAIVDVLPQLPPLPSVTDKAIASLSPQEFDAENTRDSPPRTLHGRDDAM
ncbi:hypothetical protein V8E53_001651 [Lactarius tabidus]